MTQSSTRVTARGATVLVASDFSAGADEAIVQADRWARETGARLVACHVVPYYVRVAMLFPQRHEQDAEELVAMQEQAAEALTARVTDLTGRAAEDFEVVVDAGAPDAAIVKLGEELKATLVVVGGHGESAIPRLLLGRVAERVVPYAHTAVLVARSSPKGRVLAATDLSPRSMPVVSVGAEIAERSGGALTVLHALEPGPSMMPWGRPPPPTDADREAAESALRERLRELQARADVLVEPGPAAPAIIRAAERLGAELVVVATLGRTGLARLSIGSVALAVARAAPCSVLVLRG